MTESFSLALGLLLSGDAELLRVVGLSLYVSGTATLIGAGLGLVLGAWLAVTDFRGQPALVWMLNTLLALPSVESGRAHV